MKPPKVQLAEILVKIILEKNLSQIRMAQILGIDQSKVSRLLNGDLSPYSFEKMISLINTLGYDVDIIVTPGKRKPGTLFVGRERETIQT